MKKIFLLIITAFVSMNLAAQPKTFVSYYDLSNYQQSSPGAFKFGLYGFDNPAITSYIHDGDLMFLASDKTSKLGNFSDWGLFSGSPFGGVGMLTHKDPTGTKQVIDYRYSFSFGDRTFAFGAGYGWVGGDKSYFQRSNSYQLGFLYRPWSFLSTSAHMTVAIDNDDAEYVGEVAVRPIPSYPLALFGDYSYLNFGGQKIENWSAGVSWEVVDGIRINGRYFKDERINLGVDLSFGTMGLSSLTSNLAEKNGSMNNTYALRMGAIDRSIFDNALNSIMPSKFWYKLDLSGEIKYQNSIFDHSLTLMKILEKIDILMKDNMVGGIVINATTVSGNKAIMWEVREKLKEFKKAGKKVYMFIERAGINDYHFASIADKIYMEPLGGMSLEGFATGRSYYKSMLEKVGIGFDELRFFKYKSAYENFSNEKMTEGEKEQRQKLIDDWYAVVKKDVTESRKISPEEFDNLVNGQISYRTKECIDKKLVDAEARWGDVDKLMKDDKSIAAVIDAKFINERPMPFDNKWSGHSSQIAIIYAIGECSMTSGINARSLVNDIKKAAEDDDVKAIVLRVDSPGGDALASDYIADVVRKFKDKKPIIVTQGAVAASGGYWLSMDATKVISTPMTVTGSIGVIIAWFYDKGLSEKLGITTDVIKVGKFADLGYPFQLPFIGIGLPQRPFTTDERKQQEESILKFYDDFTQMVADGRKMKKEDVQKVAQGHIWTGEAAKPLGLVDEIGGLSLAIKEAKKLAGLNADEQIDFVELPKPTFNFGELFGMLTGINLSKVNKLDSKLNNLKFMMENNGKALHMIPMDYMDFVPDYHN